MSSADIVGLIKGLAWPIVVLVVAVTYRHELAKLAQALSGRISRVSLVGVTVDLVASKPGEASLRVLDELQNTSTVGPAPTSGVPSLVELAKLSSPADYLVIDLRGGKSWLTSRLYLCAEVIAPLLEARSLVFVGTRGPVPRYFLGFASPKSVAGALETRYDWMRKIKIETQLRPLFRGQAPNRYRSWYPAPPTEAAIARLGPGLYDDQRAAALEEIVRSLVKEVFESDSVESFINEFLENPDMRRPHIDGLQDRDWVQLDQVDEHARWIEDERRLLDLFADGFVRQQVVVDQTTDSDALVKTMLHHKGGFSAITDAEGRFKNLVDRVALLEKIANEKYA
jgi:hypothetical protein